MIIALTMLALPTPLLADGRTWVGTIAGAGIWNDPLAWSPTGQPGGGDSAFILLGGANVTYANPDTPDAVLSSLQIGAQAGIATLSQNQHVLNTSQLKVGGTGGGAVVQSGGVLNVLTPEGAILGDLPVTIGAYGISGAGQLNVAGQLIVGDLGLGTFTQSGGAVRVTDVGLLPGTIVLGSNDTAAGTYTMTGGTVDAAVVQLSPFGGIATFNQSAGQVNITQELVLGDPMITGMPGSALYQHGGGTLTTPLTSIGDSGMLKHTGGIFKTGALVIDTNGDPAKGGHLDLTDQNMVIDYGGGQESPLQQIRGYVKAAYNGGKWDGPGITSSNAAANSAAGIGYAEASDVLGLSGNATALWNGQVVDATSVLLDYTLAGDADMDGKVDFADLVRLAQNYNDTSGTRTWSTGDFDYNGVVDFADLVKLAQNYNTSLPTAPIPGAPDGFGQELGRAFAQVPEPATMTLFALGAACGVAPRRRRGSR
jgi:hypothetical protein